MNCRASQIVFSVLFAVSFVIAVIGLVLVFENLPGDGTATSVGFHGYNKLSMDKRNYEQLEPVYDNYFRLDEQNGLLIERQVNSGSSSSTSGTSTTSGTSSTTSRTTSSTTRSSTTRYSTSSRSTSGSGESDDDHPDDDSYNSSYAGPDTQIAFVFGIILICFGVSGMVLSSLALLCISHMCVCCSGVISFRESKSHSPSCLTAF